MLCLNCQQSNVLVELGCSEGIPDVVSVSGMHVFHGKLPVERNNSLGRDNSKERNYILLDPDNSVSSLSLLIKFGGIKNCFECLSGKITGGDTWLGRYAEDSNKVKEQGCIDRCDHKGTRLSKVPVIGKFRNKDGKFLAILSAGVIVSCDLFHSLIKVLMIKVGGEFFL